MSLRFGIRGEPPTDLDRFMHDAWRAKKEGDMGALDRLLSQPVGGSKSGLHALRDGLTALAKLARDEHAAERREAGWLPMAELRGQLVEQHGDGWQEQRAKGRLGVVRYVWPSGVAVVLGVEGDEARVIQAPPAKPAEPSKPVLSDAQEQELFAMAERACQVAQALPLSQADKARAAVKACMHGNRLEDMRALLGRIESAAEEVGSNTHD